MTNALTNLTLALPASKTDPRALATKYKSSSFVRRLQLVTKGRLVDQGIVSPGNWAIPTDENEAEVLGSEVDVLVLATRDKALDTNENPPVQSFDPDSEVYQDIAERAKKPNSRCMYGPSFLVFERTKGEFLEVFFGNASGRQEASNLVPFLPVSEADAKKYGYEASPPKAATLKAKWIKRPNYSWHAPKVAKCSTPFDNLPPEQEIVDQIVRFLNPKVENAEVADEDEDDR